MKCPFCLTRARKRKQTTKGDLYRMVSERVRFADETRFECLDCSYYIAVQDGSKAERILRFPKEREE
jgi:transposase-like protein